MAEQRTWREYVGNSLHYIPQNQAIATLYSDILQPTQIMTKEQAARIALKIMQKAKGGF